MRCRFEEVSRWRSTVGAEVEDAAGGWKTMWAYRYRVDGRCSRRPQVGGFATRAEAERALRRTLERLCPGGAMTLAELVELYLASHQAAPATIEKLCWLLAKAIARFGEVRLAVSGRRRSARGAASCRRGIVLRRRKRCGGC